MAKAKYLLLALLLLVFFAANYSWLQVDAFSRLGTLLLPGAVLILVNYFAFFPLVKLQRLSQNLWVERIAIVVVFSLTQSLILLGLERLSGALDGVYLLGYIIVSSAFFALLMHDSARRLVPTMSRRIVNDLAKFLIFVPLVTIIVLVDLIMLRYFNTLQWPYLWPSPGLFIILALFVLIMSFPELFSGIWALRLVGLAMVFIGQCYVLHSFDVMLSELSAIAVMHFIGITGTYLVMVVSYINQIAPRDNVKAPPLPADLPFVAAVIPTYGEPLDVLEETVISLKQLDYPPDRLFIMISDDGHREDVAMLAFRYGIHYNRGARRDAKAGNLNSALKYLAEHYAQGTLVLTQDADEVVDASFLRKTVGYFADPSMAFVQTPKDAIAPGGDPFGVRDRVFYDSIQPGRNGSGAAFSCGSGVLWRIDAVKSIGGFATWNIVEDLTTSYFLHAAGYRSEYHNEVLTIGLAPDDIPGLLKQRGTWAADTWRLFLFKNPLFMPGLSLRQRMQYMELGLFYVTSSFFMPLLLLTPLLSLATGQFVPIEGSALFPWVIVSVFFYIILAQNRGEYLKRMWQYWVGHAPTYLKAFWIAVRSRDKKPSYKVTRKTRQDGFYGTLVWGQFLYVLAGAAVIVRALFFMPDVDLGARLTNTLILLFFMYLVGGICKAAFFGVAWPFKRVYRQIRSVRLLPEPSREGMRPEPQASAAD